MKKVLCALILSTFVAPVAFTSTAYAAPIGLTSTHPDIFLDTGLAVYTITGPTKTLTLTGTTRSLTTDSGSNPLTTTGTFTAIVNLVTASGSGASEVFTVASGSLTVTGNSVTEFASSTPIAFGFQNVGSPAPADFQIVFGSGTGNLATGGNIAVSYHGGTGISGYSTNFFDTAFSSNAIVKSGTADVFNTPEPTSLALLGLSIPLVLRRRRLA